jgi:uncharacterized membrane protein
MGFVLLVIGLIFLIIGVFALGEPESCPVNGCVPGEFLWLDILRAAVFFSGVVFIAIGITLLIVARRMKPMQETGSVVAQIPASEP